MPISSSFSIRRRRNWLAAVLALTTGAAAFTGPASAAENPAPAAPAGCLGTPGKAWLRVTVEDVRSGNGQIAFTVYPDDPARFLVHNGSLFVERVKAVAGSTSVCLNLPKPAVYVVAIYHDENGNGSFDRSSIGLPVEGYGFSNNPPTLLGLPSFRSVRLDVAHSGLTSHIHLTYP